MNKLKINYKVSLNVLFFGALILFLSGCAREKSTMSSIQYEKLKKQSAEIENGKTVGLEIEFPKISEEKAFTAANDEVNVSTKEAIAANQTQQSLTANSDAKGKDQKASIVQKVLAKKIAKKMNADQQNRGGLDKNLKIALVLGLVGLILSLFPYPIYIIGGIIIIVALVFVLLWALEQ